jgi:hypothetical protein
MQQEMWLARGSAGPAGVSQLGLAHWPDIMRQAITDPDGSEVTLAAALNRPDYW